MHQPDETFFIFPFLAFRGLHVASDSHLFCFLGCGIWFFQFIRHRFNRLHTFLDLAFADYDDIFSVFVKCPGKERLFELEKLQNALFNRFPGNEVDDLLLPFLRDFADNTMLIFP